MARARNIKPGFFANELLAELTFETRLLFIGLWTLADREGRLDDRPKKIRAQVFPYDEGLNIDGMLNDLEAGGFVIRYEVNGQRYAQIVNFTKHQTPHHKEVSSEIPPPDGMPAITRYGYDVPQEQRERIFTRDGCKCLKCGAKESLTIDHITPLSKGGDNSDDNLQTLCSRCNSAKGDAIKSYRSDVIVESEARSNYKQHSTLSQARPNVDASCRTDSLNPSSLNPDTGFSDTKPAARDAYTPEFEEAWAEYPQRPGASKKESFKAWGARLKAGVDVADMLAGVRRYAAYCEAMRTEPQFIKQPATFFGPGEHYSADWKAPPPQARGSPPGYQTANDKAKALADRLTGNAHEQRNTIIDIN